MFIKEKRYINPEINIAQPPPLFVLYSKIRSVTQ